MSSRREKSAPRPIDPEFWTVVNELPDPLPVTKAEIDALERYFGDVLDDVFSRTTQKSTEIKRSKS
jgi:hypothetical protein